MLGALNLLRSLYATTRLYISLIILINILTILNCLISRLKQAAKAIAILKDCAASIAV